MNSKCKTYEEEGVKYQFDSEKLMMRINQKKFRSQGADKKVTKASITEELAYKLFVSTEAVKNWLYGHNGPSELEQIKELGSYFGVDYHEFLKEEEGQMKLKTLTQAGEKKDYAQVQHTKDCVREIYKAILNYISRCRYYSYAFENAVEGDEDSDGSQLISMADTELSGLLNYIENVLEQSMLDVPEEFYDRINVYIWDDLADYIDLIKPATEEELQDEENRDYYDFSRDVIERIVRGGYQKDLRELFADYIVK